MALTVKHIFIHPVKSMASQPVEKAVVTSNGLAGDREFVLVSDKGTFMTARQYPNIVLIKATLDRECLTLMSSNGSSVAAAIPKAGAEMQKFKVWGDAVNGADMGDDMADWLSARIGKSCRLMAVTSETARNGKYRGTPNSYADAAPILLTSDASLAELNRRLMRPIPHQQLRPNIVIGGDMQAFAEDLWATIKIGDLMMDVAWGCSRCILTTVDPATGEKSGDMEPVKTLKSFRTGPDKQFYFGQNIIPQLGSQASDIIHVGDNVEIISTRERMLLGADALA